MKELIFDKATDAFFMFVKISDFLRLCNAVETGLMAVYKKISVKQGVTFIFSQNL